MPPVYRPFPMLNPRTKEINYFIDGEIRETLSTHAAVDNNCDLIISSWTHTPYSFKQEVGSLATIVSHLYVFKLFIWRFKKKIITTRSQNAITKDMLTPLTVIADTKTSLKITEKKSLASLRENSITKVVYNI